MNSIVKSIVFIFLTALILPAYAATDTGMKGTNMTANQQEKSEPVKQKVVERHHYRHYHHHHHYYHRHHYCSYCYYRSCSHGYRSSCCRPTNVFYHGCGCCANKGCCVPNYYY